MNLGKLNSILVRLNISQESCLSYYSGQANWVFCKSTDGRSVKFPARVLQFVVEKNGVCGLYQLRFKQDGSFYDIKKIKE